MRDGRFRRIGLSAVVSVALTSCSAFATGPLVTRGDPASVCTPVGQDGGAVIALDAVKNTGASAVTLDGVSPVGGSEIEVLGAAFVLDTDPAGFRGVTAAEAERQDGYRGAVLGPGQSAVLKVTVRLSGQRGSAEALRLSYRSGASDQEFTLDTIIDVRLVPDGTTCTLEASR